MARGSIIKRCPTCGNRAKPSCSHKEARYAVVYYVGKRQRWETVGPLRHVAERRLSEILADIHSGSFREPKPICFSEFSDKWLEIYARPKVKPSTWVTYRIIVQHRLKPAFGKLPLTHLTTEAIENFLSAAVHKQKLAPKTVNNTLILLKTMLKSARKWGYLRENPAEEIARLRVEPKEMDFLTPEEIRKLLEASDEPYRTLFLTAVLTGMRRGEVFGLQWGDIDWNQGRIHVRRSIYWRPRKDTNPGEPCWIFVTPKSSYSRRTIVMSPRLKEALEIHKMTCPRSEYDLVFSTRKGTPLDAISVFYNEFLPALARAGLRRIRFHDLRHTFTTLLIHQGENIKFVQCQLGHASATTTLDRYGHLMPNAQQEAGQRLDGQVFGSGALPLVGSPEQEVSLAGP